MKILAFADVLGNPHATQAILLAAKKLGEAELVCLGNACGTGADPQATVERLRKAHVHLVRGAWDAATLNMPVASTDMRIAAKAIAAKLKPSEMAYLREATPPRRLVAGGKRILLTSDTKAPADSAADVILHSGGLKPIVRRDPNTGRLDVAVGNASEAPEGESPYVLYDSETGDALVKYAAWDITVLRRRQG